MGHSQRDCPLKTAGSDSTKKRVAKVSKPSGKGTGKGLGENSSPEKTTGDVQRNKSLGSETVYRTGPETENGGEDTPERITRLLSEAATLLKALKPVAEAVKIKRVKWPNKSFGWWGNKRFEKRNPSRTD